MVLSLHRDTPEDSHFHTNVQISLYCVVLMDTHLLLALPTPVHVSGHYSTYQPNLVQLPAWIIHSLSSDGSLLAYSPMHPVSKLLHTDLTCQFLNSHGSHSSSAALNHSLSATLPRNWMMQQISTVHVARFIAISGNYPHEGQYWTSIRHALLF
jgi:hypothetical protein